MSDATQMTSPAASDERIRPPRRHRHRRIALALLGALALAVVILNWTYGRLPSEPKPSGSFAQVGGLRIHYVERPGAGTPVVLIHGLPGTAEDWNAVTPLLTGHRTIAIDRPCFGYSSGDYVPFERQLSTIHKLLAQLHVTRPILVGHSYGGTVSLGYAERYPGQVRGLVLVDAAAAGTKPNALHGLQAHAIQILQLPVIRQLSDATFSQLLLTVSAKMGDSEAFDPEPVATAHEHRVLAINMTHGNLEALAGEYLAAGGVVERIDRKLSSIATPAVVIQGGQDRLVGASYGRRLAGLLPHARLELLYGGHMQPYVHPAAIAAAAKSLAAGAKPVGP
ncbi:MAG TPA: alpha/beta hydrolase [Solirubrobacteraceae bacterium]|jgi:pimeloyl-ACP methyl ester carboxylesterase|nr:alpha/beta hydrolase [Solirubrobacteraceae bacterium]